jgi:heat shock protein HslJ
MKNRVKVSCLAVAVCFALSGCMGDKKPTQAAAPPAAAPSGAVPDRGLAGTEWRLEEMGGQPVIANSRATLNFPNNTSAAGNGSCNRFTGSVDITSSAMKFGPLATTRMMCDAESSRQENDYLKALADVDRYEIKNRLTLYLHLKGADNPLKFHAIL